MSDTASLQDEIVHVDPDERSGKTYGKSKFGIWRAGEVGVPPDTCT